jgi:phage regulator Rha-like protein
MNIEEMKQNEIELAKKVLEIKKKEKTLSSREVAEMMEIEHANLLKKIDGINIDFRKVKIDFSKYWNESSYYVEGQTRSYREFQITKRGCEFLAHKTTGTKGNLFIFFTFQIFFYKS